MTIYVNGEARELVAIDMRHMLEWTDDLLGNFSALHYDPETEKYTMDEDEFEWWDDMVDRQNRISYLISRLTYEQAEAYYEECKVGTFSGYDFDDETDLELDFLETLINGDEDYDDED